MTRDKYAPFGVVVNPRSARGRGARTARKVLQALDARGVGARVITGRDAADCSEQLREACVRGDLRGLILVGGDGLIGLVIQLAEARALPIGIVPAGSGNDFARQFALSHSPTKAVTRILSATHHPQSVDLGVSTLPGNREHWFAGALNVGFDAAINRRANAIALPIGPLRYQIALLAELMFLKSRPFSVRTHATEHSYTGLLTTVMNTRTIGGGIPLAPSASVHDGELNLVEVTHAGKRRVLSVLGRLARGTHESLPEVTITPITRIRIEAGDEVAYSDGERVGTGPFDVRVAPGALTLLA
ncbi:MAG: diacylglycerol/lipid kinase family protein [Leucobacter sp.]